MGILIKGAKEIKSIFAAVPFIDVNEFRLYGKATQNGTPTPDAPVEIEIPGSSGSIVVKSVGKNLLNNTAKTTTHNGVTYTVNDDGSVTANGTATAASYITLSNDTRQKLNTGKYIISGTPNDGNIDARVHFYDETKKVYHRDIGGGVEFDFVEGGKWNIAVYVSKGKTVNNMTFYPMIRLASVTDGTYEPYKEVTATISTPNGLPGIKVESGGNYTDSTGQQWICDEIVKYADGTGEHIQRVKKITEDGTKSYATSSVSNANGKVFLRGIEDANTNVLGGLSNKYEVIPKGATNKITTSQISLNVKSDGMVGMYMISATATNAAGFKEEVKNNPFDLIYILAEPIHTPLTAEEIAEIEKLSTIYPANNVSTSDDCDLTLLIGKRYETKEILSAWANKNNKAVEVFTNEREIVVFEATVKLENSVIVYDEYITQENTELIQSETLYYSGTGSGTVLTLTDKALKKYKSISIARSVYHESQRQWTFKYINNETGKTENMALWPAVYIGGLSTADPVKLNGNTVNFEIGAPEIDGYTFVSVVGSYPVQFAITKIRLNK